MTLRRGYYLLFDDDRFESLQAVAPAVVTVAALDWAKIDVSLGARPATFERTFAEAIRRRNQKQVE